MVGIIARNLAQSNFTVITRKSGVTRPTVDTSTPTQLNVIYSNQSAQTKAIFHTQGTPTPSVFAFPHEKAHKVQSELLGTHSLNLEIGTVMLVQDMSIHNSIIKKVHKCTYPIPLGLSIIPISLPQLAEAVHCPHVFIIGWLYWGNLLIGEGFPVRWEPGYFLIHGLRKSIADK